MNDTVYVFFGMDQESEPLDAIEKLTNATGPANAASW